MNHPFDNARVSHEPIPDYPISGIIESSSEIGEVVDQDGVVHQVNLETKRVLSFCDNIPKDIDAETLSLSNSLKNNYNLNEVTGYNTSEESPEATVNLVNFESLSKIAKPVTSTSESTSETVSNAPTINNE